MLVFLGSVLICIAAASEYEVPKNDVPSHQKLYQTFAESSSSEEKRDSYNAPLITDNFYGRDGPNTGDYGVPAYNENGGNGYGNPHKEECRHIKQLHVRNHRTARAAFKQLKREGKTYTIISCPNSGKAYALVAEKDGADTIFTFASGVSVQDTILLASGFNFDFSAKCHDNSVFGESFNGRDVSIKKVACVELAHPNGITGL